MDWISAGTSADHSSHNESKKMSGSYGARYYDQIITTLHLQAIQENEYGMQPFSFSPKSMD